MVLSLREVRAYVDLRRAQWARQQQNIARRGAILESLIPQLTETLTLRNVQVGTRRRRVYRRYFPAGASGTGSPRSALVGIETVPIYGTRRPPAQFVRAYANSILPI